MNDCITEVIHHCVVNYRLPSLPSPACAAPSPLLWSGYHAAHIDIADNATAELSIGERESKDPVSPRDCCVVSLVCLC